MLILTMSFSGSMVFLAILLCAVFGKKVISSAWAYNMLRICLVFFCLPLPLYNSEYRHRLFQVLGIQEQWDTADLAAENIIGIGESGELYFNIQIYIIVIWLVWLSGLLFAMIRNLYRYRNIKMIKENPPICQSNYLEIFNKVKKELGIKKGVALLCADNAQTVCTIGIVRKYVIVPEGGMTDAELYYSLKHELIHVKRADVVWRYICLFAVLLHWFNPVVYFYFYVMCVYCEQSCDAVLVQNLDKVERKEYGKLIIKMSQEAGFGKWKYQTCLGGSKKIIEWRLISMLESGKKKKTERMLSLLLGAVILFGGSLTVCAYENPLVIEDADASMFESLRDEANTWSAGIGEITYSEEGILDFVEFVGDDGSHYYLLEPQGDEMKKAGCEHSYVSGYVKEHHKNADGSCKTNYYHVDICSKCGGMKNKKYSHTETSSKCTH